MRRGGLLGAAMATNRSRPSPSRSWPRSITGRRSGRRAGRRNGSLMTMTIKNERELQRMEEAGRVVALIHSRIEPAIMPGVSTAELDEIARDVLSEVGAVSSFLG